MVTLLKRRRAEKVRRRAGFPEGELRALPMLEGKKEAVRGRKAGRGRAIWASLSLPPLTGEDWGHGMASLLAGQEGVGSLSGGPGCLLLTVAEKGVTGLRPSDLLLSEN